MALNILRSLLLSTGALSSFALISHSAPSAPSAFIAPVAPQVAAVAALPPKFAFAPVVQQQAQPQVLQPLPQQLQTPVLTAEGAPATVVVQAVPQPVAQAASAAIAALPAAGMAGVTPPAAPVTANSIIRAAVVSAGNSSAVAPNSVPAVAAPAMVSSTVGIAVAAGGHGILTSATGAGVTATQPMAVGSAAAAQPAAAATLPMSSVVGAAPAGTADASLPGAAATASAVSAARAGASATVAASAATAAAGAAAVAAQAANAAADPTSANATKAGESAQAAASAATEAAGAAAVAAQAANQAADQAAVAGATAHAAANAAAASASLPSTAAVAAAGATAVASDSTGAAAAATPTAAPHPKWWITFSLYFPQAARFAESSYFAVLVKGLCMASNILVQVSPYPQVRNWETRGETGEADSAPYVSIAFGGWQWCFYGIFAFLLTKRHGFLILVHSNVLGALLGTYYTIAFYKNCRNGPYLDSLQRYLSAAVALVFLQICALIVLPPERALFLTGLISSFSSFVAGASMLVTVPTVLRTKDASSIPGAFVWASIISCVVWVLCGWMLDDMLVIGPNLFCMGVSLINLFLKYKFPSVDVKGDKGSSKTDSPFDAAMTLAKDAVSRGRHVALPQAHRPQHRRPSKGARRRSLEGASGTPNELTPLISSAALATLESQSDAAGEPRPGATDSDTAAATPLQSGAAPTVLESTELGRMRPPLPRGVDCGGDGTGGTF